MPRPRPLILKRSSGRAVKSGVHFDSVEFRRVVGEVVGGLHLGWVERAFPAGREVRECTKFTKCWP